MFKAKNERKKKKPFSVLDIETNKKGEVLSIALYDGKKVYDFLSWIDFMIFLSDNHNKKRFQQIFAHYGGGFDWVSFIESQLDNLDECKIIASGSQVVFIELYHFPNKIMLCDSVLTLLASLDVLCDKFKTRTKKLKGFDIENIENIFNENPKLYYEYLHADVKSLFQVMNEFMELLEIKAFPVSAASLAMNLFRERFLDEDHILWKADLVKSYRMNDKKIYVPSHEKKWNIIDEFITRAYAGGRVECFRAGLYEHVNTYDINSLYPSVMINAPIPTCTPVSCSDFREGKIGFYEVKFRQDNFDIPPILWEKTKNGLEFKYSGEGVFCSIELDNARSHGVEVEFIKGIYYPTTQKVFKKYVQHFYNLRLENKGNAMDFIAKILLNSLYGKFAELQEGSHLEKITLDNVICRVTGIDKDGKKILDDKGNWKKEKITEYNMEKDLYTVGEKRDIPHRLVHVSAIITAMARTELYKYIESNVDKLIYCDTDSVHLNNGTLEDKFLGTELGKMKLEESGPGVYLGRKQYAVSKCIKFKGVNARCKLSSGISSNILTMRMLADLYSGEYTEENPLTFSYNSFPKMRGVLRGEKAAKIKELNKTLKVPDYQSNFLKN